jgi:Xaa-Pro aminopeptidase
MLLADFTRLKLVKRKKELELAREAAIKAKLIAEGKLAEKANEAYITADFDAADDAVVVF